MVLGDKNRNSLTRHDSEILDIMRPLEYQPCTTPTSILMHSGPTLYFLCSTIPISFLRHPNGFSGGRLSPRLPHNLRRPHRPLLAVLFLFFPLDESPFQDVRGEGRWNSFGRPAKRDLLGHRGQEKLQHRRGACISSKRGSASRAGIQEGSHKKHNIQGELTKVGLRFPRKNETSSRFQFSLIHMQIVIAREVQHTKVQADFHY